MPIVVVANPKGGVGKSTLSTNVAGYFASQGHAVMLGDADRLLTLQNGPPPSTTPPAPLHRSIPVFQQAQAGNHDHSPRRLPK